MTNENKILRLCSTVKLDIANVDILSEIVNDDLDWAYVIELATINRVFPLLYRNLKKYCCAQVPSSVLKELRILCLTNNVINLRHLTGMLSVVGILESNHIDVLVFKGLALAADVYGDIGLRSFSDLDLLVSRKNLRKAIHLLIQEGFRTDIDLSLGQYEKLVARGHHAILVKDSAVVELHWELSGRYFGRPIDFESVFPRAETIFIDQNSITSLCSEDLLVYLCVHGCRHYWREFDSVCCVNELIRAKPDLDWELTFKIAKDQGALKMLCLGLHLARQALHLQLPFDVISEIEKNQKIVEISSRINNSTFNSDRAKLAKQCYKQEVLYNYAIMDNSFDWVRFSIKPLINTTRSDWEWVKVPAKLSSIYYILRPLRLIWKYSKKFFN